MDYALLRSMDDIIPNYTPRDSLISLGSARDGRNNMLMAAQVAFAMHYGRLAQLAVATDAYEIAQFYEVAKYLGIQEINYKNLLAIQNEIKRRKQIGMSVFSSSNPIANPMERLAGAYAQELGPQAAELYQRDPQAFQKWLDSETKRLANEAGIDLTIKPVLSNVSQPFSPTLTNGGRYGTSPGIGIHAPVNSNRSGPLSAGRTGVAVDRSQPVRSARLSGRDFFARGAFGGVDKKESQPIVDRVSAKAKGAGAQVGEAGQPAYRQQLAKLGAGVKEGISEIKQQAGVVAADKAFYAMVDFAIPSFGMSLVFGWNAILIAGKIFKVKLKGWQKGVILLFDLVLAVLIGLFLLVVMVFTCNGITGGGIWVASWFSDSANVANTVCSNFRLWNVLY